MFRSILFLAGLGLLATACGSEVTYFPSQGSGEGGGGSTSSLASVVTTTTTSGGAVDPRACETLCETRVQTCPNEDLDTCISICGYRHEAAADLGCFGELENYDTCWPSSPCNQGTKHPIGPDPEEACYESDLALRGCSYSAGCFISVVELHTGGDGEHSCFGETFCEDAYQWTRCAWADGDAMASCECFEGNVAVGTCQSKVDEMQTCQASNCCLPVK